jgi:sulfur-oxidizing protein SoxZ
MSTRTPGKGDVVVVKVMVTHPMESGIRKNAHGERIPRNIVTHFECSMAGEPLMSWQLEASIAQNPYLEFRFVAQESGDLKMRWVGENGFAMEAVETIKVG